MDLVWYPYGLETPQAEFRFHPVRKWRFDFCWPTKKVAVEIEGGIWTHGAHSRAVGIMRDITKYNEATRLGYRVFRFTPSDLKAGRAQTYMCRVFKGN